MKLALASDLHLEFAGVELKNEEGADALILSGDICVAEDLKTELPTDNEIALDCRAGKKKKYAIAYKFFEQVCSEFPKVFYVAGNHEHYHGNFDKTFKVLKEKLPFPNLHIMERDSVSEDGFIIVGSTLWTNCNNMDSLTFYHLRAMMNDYRVIKKGEDYRRWTPEMSAGEHIKNLQYVRLCVLQAREEGKKVVVIGHHAPTKLSCADYYKDDHIMNGGYSSDLSEFILDHPEIVLWTHGHTHDPFDYEVGTCRVVCNPRGYFGYETSANNFKLKYIEV